MDFMSVSFYSVQPISRSPVFPGEDAAFSRPGWVGSVLWRARPEGPAVSAPVASFRPISRFPLCMGRDDTAWRETVDWAMGGGTIRIPLRGYNGERLVGKIFDILIAYPGNSNKTCVITSNTCRYLPMIITPVRIRTVFYMIRRVNRIIR